MTVVQEVLAELNMHAVQHPLSNKAQSLGTEVAIRFVTHRKGI